MRINDDWDALGMRASGSHSVTFDGVELPAAALRGGFPTGEPVPYLERNLPSGLFHASASLGIAEAAFARAAGRSASATTRGRRMLVAESAIDLATVARRDLARGRLIDDHHAANPTAAAPTRRSSRCSPRRRRRRRSSTRRRRASSTARSRCPAAPATSTARRWRAPTATSGPGAFMHPLGANRAYEFLGDVALGRPHALR